MLRAAHEDAAGLVRVTKQRLPVDHVTRRKLEFVTLDVTGGMASGDLGEIGLGLAPLHRVLLIVSLHGTTGTRTAAARAHHVPHPVGHRRKLKASLDEPHLGVAKVQLRQTDAHKGVEHHFELR
ncbi:hypothetical protein D3C87_1751850 [compost metagenome]